MLACVALIAALAGGAVPAAASTFVPETKTCPVGGEQFPFNALASISVYGTLPDGMPVGSGRFPIELAQCPGNGLVLYEDFDEAARAKLAPILAGAEYRALRAAGETRYYLAYRLALALGERNRVGLLLSALWEAKNDDPESARTRRYRAEFVAAVRALPDDGTLSTLGLRARAANELREAGQFADAEALRAAIDPKAGDEKERAGLAAYVARLAAPIARRDATRVPIDMIGNREAARRCLAAEFAKKWEEPAPAPLTAFEKDYCARADLGPAIAAARGMLGE